MTVAVSAAEDADEGGGDPDGCGQADGAAADADHEQSQELAERGYAHMFELSQGLATAVGDAVAAKLPQGGPATGGGGLAGAQGLPAPRR